MRDQLITESEFYERRIKIKYELIETYFHRIQTGETPNERVNTMKQAFVWDYISIIGCKYSAGYLVLELTDDLICAIHNAFESWVDNAWKLYIKNRYLNQYTIDAYDEMLWMLSLGYLLNIPNEDFLKLVDIIDRDRIKDFLFEFIIRAKIKDRQSITEESYECERIRYGKIRQAITETDKIKAADLIKEFVTKDWYREHKHAGWYNSHKSIHEIYHGYWCYEAAAVVQIMGLDDSAFKDWKYYPKDLVGLNP